MRGRELPLTDRLAALREAVDVAAERLEGPDEAAALARARSLLAKAGARTALGEATVVALAGATGSGKSTLFNALSGAEVSSPGVRRPTTGVAHATVWGEESQDRLLDWLEVPRRHRHPPDPALDGLVLLDLPDHDSVRLEHRLEVDRLVGLVDVLVWVLDPEKYADAAVHERYLLPLAGHAGVLLVVLNQVDRLDPAAARACLTDLRGLLDREGLADTPLLAVSARTGTGLGELRGDLVRRVAARRAATERLTADVRSAAGELRACCAAPVPRRNGPSGGGSGDGGVGRADRERLTDALARAAGVPVVGAAVERSVRREGTAVTGWPVVRWTRKLRPDPLRRLHLGEGTPGGVVARTSLPAAGAVARAEVGTAVRAAREAAGAGLPRPWADALRREVEVSEERLADRLDAAVAGTDLGPDRTPLWQRAVGGLQWLLAGVALVGVLWLLALVGLGLLQLDDVLPLPRVEGIPLPTLLAGGGLLAGALLALLARPLVGARARRRRRRAELRLRAAVAEVGQAELLGPMAAVRADHHRFAAALARAG
jgi:energy-coupling factor transporter ATP-binding protein EcfA2